MDILGLSCFYHDSAAALIRNGKVIAAAQEERFTRIKHDERFPHHAVDFCLRFGKISASQLDAVAFYEKPFLKFERILLTALDNFPRGVFSFVPAMKIWLTQKLWIKQLIYEALAGYTGPIYFPEHHMSHAASCFLVSPFHKAAILTMDGVGEWATGSRGCGEVLDITLTDEIHFPHSLGLLYSAFTYYLGFKVNSAEYKVMGLAPYGKPVYTDKILSDLVDLKKDGSFKLNLSYFAYPYGLTMTSPAFHKLFDGEPMPQGAKPTQREMDIAASLQKVTDEIMVRAAADLYRMTRLKSLCMAGGVALNCVSNSEILKRTPFTDLFVQPAAGDAGCSIGAAAYVYHTLMRKPRRAAFEHAYLGPSFEETEVRKFLSQTGVPFRRLSRGQLIQKIVDLVIEQQVVGLFQGRMEFGPRALGNRSILADARNPKNRDRVNLKIKCRESFRPFAPSVLEENAKEWFDLSLPSPYMLLVAQSKTKKIPAVTHVDGSARIQTVSQTTNPFFWEILSEFKRRTGVPVLINTSFNQRGEPIVCIPKDAFSCFLRTDMDYLVIGPFLVDKRDMPDALIKKARGEKFALD